MMKNRTNHKNPIIIATFLAMAISLAQSCSSDWKVTRVVDGDTVWVKKGLSSEKVRLKGVDAPEIAHPNYGRFNTEHYGYESKDCLADMVAGETVRLVSGSSDGLPEKDKYGRTLAYLMDGSTDVNALVIERGCAKAYRRFDHPRRSHYIDLESRARETGAGLWTKSQQNQSLE